MKKLWAFILGLLLVGCTATNTMQSTTPPPEAVSFAGKPLISTPAAPKALAKSDSIIKVIRSKGNLGEDDYVEIGKQLAGTNRFGMAVENFNQGLSKYPDSYKLLRNRGHRYINLRQLDKSIKDLTRAEKLIRDRPDDMEYGLDLKPTATVRHQIWYHIGVYHFLKKDYKQSATAFENALATAKAGSTGNIVGATDWLYSAYMKMGLKEKADALLIAIAPDMDTDREQPYFRRIMLYKGVIKPADLIDVNKNPAELSVADVTKMYGLGNWYAFSGDQATATTLYNKILQSNAWPGFAYAAAEIEVMKPK